jgi:hypothetical protein
MGRLEKQIKVERAAVLRSFISYSESEELPDRGVEYSVSAGTSCAVPVDSAGAAAETKCVLGGWAMLWLRRMAPGDSGGLSTGEAVSGDAADGTGVSASGEGTGRGGLQGHRRWLVGSVCSESASWPRRRSAKKEGGGVVSRRCGEGLNQKCGKVVSRVWQAPRCRKECLF